MVEISKGTVMTPVTDENWIEFNVIIGARRTVDE